MLSAYLVRLVEQHADTLTDELVADLQSNARTPTFHRLSRDELHHRAYTVYHGLGNWLANTDDPSMEAKFESHGRQRFHEHVPLSELVYAATLMKYHLRDKIRSVGNIYSALELHNELQLTLLIGRFFDRMLYSMVAGYEQARDEAEHPPRPATVAKTPLDKTPIKVEWIP